MRLHDYMSQNNVSAYKLQALSGVSRITIYKILKGKNTWLDKAYAIEKATKGQVSVYDLLPITQKAV